MKSALLKELENNIRAVIARAYVRIVGLNRELSWIAFDTFMPILSMASYAFIYKSMNANEALIGYVILGGAMTAFWLNVLWGMAAQFYWEKEMGNLELFLIAPLSRMSLLAGMAVGGMYTTTLRSLLSFIVGNFIFGVYFHIQNPLLLVLTFILTLLALYGMGMIGSSLFLLYGREAWHTSNLLEEPVFLLSGFYFPVKSLGFWAGNAAVLIPITLGLDAMRQLIYGVNVNYLLLPVNTEIILLALQSVLYFILARYFLRVLENVAKKEGRLTLRYQ